MNIKDIISKRFISEEEARELYYLIRTKYIHSIEKHQAMFFDAHIRFDTEKERTVEETTFCEKCGKETKFTLNCCEDCFDEETDRYYDGGHIDEEDE